MTTSEVLSGMPHAHLSAGGVPIERDRAVDVARGVGMILVIYGHILQIFFHRRADGIFLESAYEQWRAIYSFHMPMFFVLAGMASLSRAVSLRDAARRALAFLLLAFAVDLIGIAVTWLISGSAAVPSWRVYIVGHLLKLEEFSIITPWFLVAMGLVYVTSAVLDAAPKAWKPAVVLAVAAISAAAYAGPQFWHLRALAPGLAFYQVGRWLAAGRVALPIWLSVLLLSSALAAAHLNSGCSLPWEASCDNSELPGRFCVLMIFGFFGNVPLFFLTAFAGSLGCIGLSRAVANFDIRKPLVAIGRRSVELLILNGFALVFLNAVLRDYVPAWDSPLFLALVGALTVAAHLLVLAAVAPAMDWLRRNTKDAASAIVTTAGRNLRSS